MSARTVGAAHRVRRVAADREPRRVREPRDANRARVERALRFRPPLRHRSRLRHDPHATRVRRTRRSLRRRSTRRRHADAAAARRVSTGVRPYPPHAAVSETVALAPKRTQGFVNAVLRKLSAAGPMRWPSDAARLSYPDWLAARLIAELGADDAAASMVRMNEPPPVSQRVDGYVQDLSSQWVATTVGARPGDRVLDVCAAPGGKSTALAATGADVVAMDVRLSRDRSRRRQHGAPRGERLGGRRRRDRAAVPRRELRRGTRSMRRAAAWVHFAGAPMLAGVSSRPTSTPSPRCSGGCWSPARRSSGPAAGWCTACAR